MAASSATAMLTEKDEDDDRWRQGERGRQPERLCGALDHRLTGDRADDHAGDGADRHGHKDLANEDGRHLERREPDGLHDPDVAIARQHDPTDDVGDRESGREESEDREREQDRDVQLGDRVHVRLRLEIGRRRHHRVRREARGDAADRRREVGGSARWVNPIEHLPSGRRVGGQRRKIGGAHPAGDVRGADRRGDADHREGPRGLRRRGILVLPGRHDGRASGRGPLGSLASERRLDIQRHQPTDLGAEPRGRGLVEDDLAGRAPPASGRDGHPVDRIARRRPPGHDLVPDHVVLPRHISARHGPRTVAGRDAAGGLRPRELGIADRRVVVDHEMRTVRGREGMVEWFVRLDEDAQREGRGAGAKEQDDREDDRLQPPAAEIGNGLGRHGAHHATIRAARSPVIAPSTRWMIRWARP